MKNNLKLRLSIFLLCISPFAVQRVQAQSLPTSDANITNETVTPLDPSVQIQQSDQNVSTVFKDMVVVQRKAKKKAGHFLFSTHSTIDFSDGPITNYAINTNIGYAISDFWEAYINFVPYFIVNERPIVKKVQGLTLQNGGTATISYSKPKSQVDIDILWLPAYGKESWGPYSLIRSDTFLKFSAAQIQYEADTGLRFATLLGKTYFLYDLLNLRVAAGATYSESVLDNKKTFNWAPVLEAGLVLYF